MEGRSPDDAARAGGFRRKSGHFGEIYVESTYVGRYPGPDERYAIEEAVRRISRKRVRFM